MFEEWLDYFLQLAEDWRLATNINPGCIGELLHTFYMAGHNPAQARDAIDRMMEPTPFLEPRDFRPMVVQYLIYVKMMKTKRPPARYTEQFSSPE